MLQVLFFTDLIPNMEIFLLTFPGFREGEKIGTKPQMRKIVEMPLTDTCEGTLDLFT
jgi:hypothetical protein